MIDACPNNWGLKPILFHIGVIGISSYSFFVMLGLAAGLAVYFYEARRVHENGDNSLFIVFGSMAGGIIGAKILEWGINYRLIFSSTSEPQILLSGRTIIGGFIGGMAGSHITKRYLGIKDKKGNLFAPGIALGVAIGRIGCFLHGCCYGKPTSLFWGVNFGDGIMRHPTQLYESIFMFAMFVWLERVNKRANIKPGQLFKTLMVAYFTFRFFAEFIRVEAMAFWGFSVFQVISLGAIIYLLRNELIMVIRKTASCFGGTYGRTP